MTSGPDPSPGLGVFGRFVEAGRRDQLGLPADDADIAEASARDAGQQADRSPASTRWTAVGGLALGSGLIVGEVAATTVTTAKAWALALYTVGFLMQMIGAALVIWDVLGAIRNTRQLKSDLVDAARLEGAHHHALETGPEIVRAFRSALGQDRTDQIVRQLGPTSLLERAALVRYLKSQSQVSDLRRWIALAILLLGVAAGFAASVISLWA